MTQTDDQLRWLAIKKILLTISRQLEAIATNTQPNNAPQQIQGEVTVRPPLDLGIADKPSNKTRADNNRDSNWRWWVKTTLEVLGFFVLSYYACTTHNQWVTMEEQTKLSIQSFRTDERAWIEIGSITHDTKLTPREFLHTFLSDRMFIYHLYPKNLGKTAAYDVTMHVGRGTNGPYDLGFSDIVISKMQNGFLTGKETPPESSTSNSFDYIPSVLGPGESPISPYNVESLSPYPVKFADTGKMAIYYGYLIGRIDYRDAFKVQHWMTFCFVVLNTAGDLKNCNKGNDQDRNLETPPAATMK